MAGSLWGPAAVVSAAGAAPARVLSRFPGTGLPTQKD
ncbi:hypothetical protein QFZ79_004488 [Arthrobacter sp. V4I6]|nr:hypothetical protein [Arthrobacter sp. V1I7]MDQ0856377.1 hypothetical protein [Arthrobacter sp. V4I6]